MGEEGAIFKKEEKGRGGRIKGEGEGKKWGPGRRRLGQIKPDMNSWKLGNQSTTVCHLTLEVFLFNFQNFNHLKS